MPSGVSYPHATVSISTTATFLTTGGGENDGFLVHNRGPADVFLGGSSVTADETSAGGLPLAEGQTVTVPTVGNASLDLYGITAEGSAYVSVVNV